MWKFESYLEEHKIAMLDIGECLAEQYENIDVWPVYRPLTKRWEKNQFKIYEHLPCCIKRKIDGSQWYGEWKYHIADYDTIIIGNSLRGRDVIEYIQKRNPTARIIVYYTSIIDEGNRKDPRRYAGLDIEFCTFDKGDSERLGIRYLPYYYSLLSTPLAELRKKTASFRPKQDVFLLAWLTIEQKNWSRCTKFFKRRALPTNW